MLWVNIKLPAQTWASHLYGLQPSQKNASCQMGAAIYSFHYNGSTYKTSIIKLNEFYVWCWQERFIYWKSHKQLDMTSIHSELKLCLLMIFTTNRHHGRTSPYPTPATSPTRANPRTRMYSSVSSRNPSREWGDPQSTPRRTMAALRRLYGAQIKGWRKCNSPMIIFAKHFLRSVKGAPVGGDVSVIPYVRHRINQQMTGSEHRSTTDKIQWLNLCTPLCLNQWQSVAFVKLGKSISVCYQCYDAGLFPFFRKIYYSWTAVKFWVTFKTLCLSTQLRRWWQSYYKTTLLYILHTCTTKSKFHCALLSCQTPGQWIDRTTLW